MTDTFTFPNTQEGRDMRAMLCVNMLEQGRDCVEYEETWTGGKQSTTVLRLDVSKRPDEGKIAQFMKERKA